MNGRLTSRHVRSVETSDIFERWRFIPIQNFNRHESLFIYLSIFGSPATYEWNLLLESTLPWLPITQIVETRSQVLSDSMLIRVPFFLFHERLNTASLKPRLPDQLNGNSSFLKRNT